MLIFDEKNNVISSGSEKSYTSISGLCKAYKISPAFGRIEMTFRVYWLFIQLLQHFFDVKPGKG